MTINFNIKDFRGKFITLEQLQGKPEMETISVYDKTFDARIRIRLPVKQNVNRNTKTWRNTFDRFRKFGFSIEESAWASDQNLKLNNENVAAVVKARRSFVRDFQTAFGANREEAIEAAAEFNRDRNIRRGAIGRDVYNVFREISP